MNMMKMMMIAGAAAAAGIAGYKIGRSKSVCCLCEEPMISEEEERERREAYQKAVQKMKETQKGADDDQAKAGRSEKNIAGKDPSDRTGGPEKYLHRVPETSESEGSDREVSEAQIRKALSRVRPEILAFMMMTEDKE